MNNTDSDGFFSRRLVYVVVLTTVRSRLIIITVPLTTACMQDDLQTDRMD